MLAPSASPKSRYLSRTRCYRRGVDDLDKMRVKKLCILNERSVCGRRSRNLALAIIRAYLSPIGSVHKVGGIRDGSFLLACSPHQASKLQLLQSAPSTYDMIPAATWHVVAAEMADEPMPYEKLQCRDWPQTTMVVLGRGLFRWSPARSFGAAPEQDGPPRQMSVAEK